jgi:hypothetical protein
MDERTNGETHPLKHLLPPDVVQPGIEILDPARNVLELVLVVALDGSGLTNDKVEGEFDAAVGVVLAHPVYAARRRRGREAEHVVACLGSAEGKATGGGAALGDYSVVIVEEFLWERTLVSIVPSFRGVEFAGLVLGVGK